MSPVSALMIAEVMPNPTGQDGAPKPNGEWVELYNNESNNIFLQDYFITNSYGKDKLTATQTLKPKEYVTLYRDGSRLSLNNKKDTIILKHKDRIIDKVIYNNTKEGLSISLTEKGWIGQIPTPNKPNTDRDYKNACDWQVNINLTKEIFDEKAEWAIVTIKNYGERNRITLTRKVKDMEGNMIHMYSNYSFYATRKKTIRNRLRLPKGKAYQIETQIHTHDCNDLDKTNNIRTKLFFINGTKVTNKTLYKAQKDENIINETKNSIIYTSNDKKAQDYAPYILCIVQALVIIGMVWRK